MIVNAVARRPACRYDALMDTVYSVVAPPQALTRIARVEALLSRIRILARRSRRVAIERAPSEVSR